MPPKAAAKPAAAAAPAASVAGRFGPLKLAGPDAHRPTTRPTAAAAAAAAAAGASRQRPVVIALDDDTDDESVGSSSSATAPANQQQHQAKHTPVSRLSMPAATGGPVATMSHRQQVADASSVSSRPDHQRAALLVQTSKGAAAASQRSSAATSSTSSSSSAVRKRQRQQPAAASKPRRPRTGSNPKAEQTVPDEADKGASWPDKHRPRSVDELAVAAVKVAAIDAWLRRACLSPPVPAADCQTPVPRLLVVHGPPGSGKSATVRLLAERLGAQLLTWSCPVDGGSEQPVAARNGGGGGGGGDFSVSLQQRRLRNFSEFLRASRPYQSFADESADSDQPAAAAADGAAAGAGGAAAGQRPSVLLIDELPVVLHSGGSRLDERGATAVREFGAMLGRALDAARWPLVLLVSQDASSGPLDYLLPPELLHSAAVTVIPMNGVPPTRLRKVLERVAAREQLSMPGDQLRSLAEEAQGDLRQALLTLQFLAVRPVPLAPQDTPTDADGSSSDASAADDQAAGPCGMRQAGMSLFQALGKVLYQKRRPQPPDAPSGARGRGPLEFSVEAVLDGLGFESGSWLAFVHQNMPPFSTDLDDLADAAAWLSTADMLASSADPLRSLEDASVSAGGAYRVGASDVPAVLGTRGVIASIRHPAPRRFQAFHAPRWARLRPEVERRRLLFTHHADRLNGSAGGDGGRPVGLATRTELATERVPYLMQITRCRPPWHFLRQWAGTGGFTSAAHVRHVAGDGSLSESCGTRPADDDEANPYAAAADTRGSGLPPELDREAAWRQQQLALLGADDIVDDG
eukprot:TRINITY_DN825_c0_g1_i2.p1 TRINITY_DN825_c0_g1~~TRINITY_DN825_c0_g1_i2.p1  ORF type:complete len:805 (+),score=298.11 TRINITY_DN825_c0_g1_i2:2583-4997(+)